MNRIRHDIPWFVVQAQPRREERAMYALHRAGYMHFYLPRFRVEKWNKRTNTYRETERALMPGYLFLGVGNGDFERARKCEGVTGFLCDFDYHPIPVPSKEVERLFLAEVDMQFDDTRKARKHREETLDKLFPAGIPVVLSMLGSVMHGQRAFVLDTKGANKVQIDMGALGKTWVRADQLVVA